MSCVRDTLWTRTQAPSLFCPRGVKMSSGEFILPDPPREFTQIEWHSYKAIHIRLCESSQGTLGAWTLLGKVWKYVPLQWILMDFDGFWWILMDFLAVGRIISQAAVTLNISVWKLKHREESQGPSPSPSSQYEPSKQLYPRSSQDVSRSSWRFGMFVGWMKALLAPHSLCTKQRPISKRTKIQCL